MLVALLALAVTPALGVLQVGQVAPNWSLPDTAWVNHRLADFRGQVVLLNFWMEF
jgi:peroxiredoxin